jgi:hypothetical protein
MCIQNENRTACARLGETENRKLGMWLKISSGKTIRRNSQNSSKTNTHEDASNPKIYCGKIWPRHELAWLGEIKDRRKSKTGSNCSGRGNSDAKNQILEISLALSGPYAGEFGEKIWRVTAAEPNRAQLDGLRGKMKIDAGRGGNWSGGLEWAYLNWLDF